MNEFEGMLQQHAAPRLEPDEKIEASAVLYSNAFSRKFFVAAATKKKIVLVDVVVGVFKFEPTFKQVREIPYRAVASIRSLAFFNQKTIILNLHSGELLRFRLNTRLKNFPGQKTFVTTLEDLYREFTPDQESLPPPADVAEHVQLAAMESSRAQVRLNQNFAVGVVAGAIAAAAAAAVWAAITIITEHQISWMAIGVGLFVGSAVRVLGRGIDRAFGVAAAVLSLAGCVVGNFLWAAYFFAQELGIALLEGLDLLIGFPSLAFGLMKATFSANDILYYGIAAFVGYRLAFKSLPKPTGAGID